MTIARVAGFDPQTNGLHFPNAFPNIPLVTIPLPGHGSLPIGDAANGLCGGMAFAVRDCFEAHRAPPPDVAAPAAGPVFDFLVRRLVDSFDVPAGPLRYFEWMSAPDDDVGDEPGVATRTRSEIPAVRAAIDANTLCALGLIRAHSADPKDLGKNHQVLAFGYEQDDASGRLTLHLYDPNHPDADTTFSCISDPGVPLDLQYSSGEPTRAFFVTPYRPVDPGPLFGAPAPRLAWLGSLARIFTRLFGARA